MKPVIAELRRLRVRIIVYLDDFLIMHESKQGAIDHFNLTSNTLRNLGFLINLKKSSGVPCQTIEFLGMIVDARILSFALPLDKLKNIKLIGESLLRSKHPSIRNLSTLLGLLAWTIQAVPYTQAHYRIFQNFLMNSSKIFDYNKEVQLPEEVKQEIGWWVNKLSEVNGKSFYIREPYMVIYSDASLSGWGA